MVERLLCTQKVHGSNPCSSKIKKHRVDASTLVKGTYVQRKVVFYIKTNLPRETHK